MEIICVSADARQCNIAYSIVHVQLCSFKNSSIYVIWPGKRLINKALLCFRLVCAHGTNMLKNDLRTFEAKILKIFMNIQRASIQKLDALLSLVSI